MKVVCLMCATEFEAVGRQAKFCPSCKKVRQREAKCKYNRKNYLQKCRIADAEKAAAETSSEISRIDREAAKLGMSYGQYVAHMERKGDTMNKKSEKKPPKSDTIRLLIAKAAEALKRSEVDCKEIGEAYGLLTAAQMILDGDET